MPQIDIAEVNGDLLTVARLLGETYLHSQPCDTQEPSMQMVCGGNLDGFKIAGTERAAGARNSWLRAGPRAPRGFVINLVAGYLSPVFW